jgi:hypothetical protein
MSGARQHPVKRDANRPRPAKSWHQISLPLIRELGLFQSTVFLVLVLAADVILATIMWFIVGPLMR